MTLHAAQTLETPAGNPDPEMGAKTLGIGTGVAGVEAAFVQHFQPGRLQALQQPLLHLLGGHAHDGSSVSFM